MKRVKLYLLALVLCLTLGSGLIFANAAEDLNLTNDFWSGEVAESDGYLRLTTGGNECFFGVEYEVTGNYTLEYEFKDLSPWKRSGGEWRNANHGGEAWIVLGSKKANGQWQGDVRGHGSGGVCIRVTDGSMESYDFVGGPYPFYYADGTPIPPNTSWTPAGTYAQLIDARLIYRFVVNSDERKIEIWAGFKDVNEPELQLQYRGYLTYGYSTQTDGCFMMMFYHDSLVDNFKIMKEGETVFSLDFNGDEVPEEIASSLPQDRVTVVNASKTITKDNPLSSEFFVKWDFYKQTDYLYENIFYAKSEGDGDILSYVFGRDGEKENVISFAKNSQTLTVDGQQIAATIAGTASYDLTKGAYFKMLMHNDGLVEIYIINKILRCPVEHCEMKLLNSYQLTREQVEGYMELSTSGKVRIDGYTVGERSIGVYSVIHGITIDNTNFSAAKVGDVLPLSASFDITTPLAENMGLYWTVESGDGEIVDGSKLKINGSGAITIKAVSTYDESVFATETVYVPEIQSIAIDEEFDKAVGSTVSLKAFVTTKPNIERFSDVIWQVVEGDATVDKSGNLTIKSSGRITVKAISVYDRTVNTEYSFIADATSPQSAGELMMFIVLSASAVALVAAAIIIPKTKKVKI